MKPEDNTVMSIATISFPLGCPINKFEIVGFDNEYYDRLCADNFRHKDTLAEDNISIGIQEFTDLATSQHLALLPDRAPGYVLRTRTWGQKPKSGTPLSRID
jgi:hypothetical protein